MASRNSKADSALPNWVPLDRAISLAQSNLGQSGDEYRHLMREHAKVAMELLGLFYIARKNAEIDVSAGGLFRKPCDFMAPIAVQLIGLDGPSNFPTGCITPVFNSWVDDCQSCQAATNVCESVAVNESQNHFKVTPKPTVGTMRLLYWAYPSDEDGRILIPRYSYTAVASYLEWQMLKTRQRRVGYRTIPKSMVDSAKEDWKESARESKGRKNTPSAASMPMVGASWLVMTPNIRGLLNQRITPVLNNAT